MQYLLYIIRHKEHGSNLCRSTSLEYKRPLQLQSIVLQIYNPVVNYCKNNLKRCIHILRAHITHEVLFCSYVYHKDQGTAYGNNIRELSIVVIKYLPLWIAFQKYICKSIAFKSWAEYRLHVYLLQLLVGNIYVLPFSKIVPAPCLSIGPSGELFVTIIL